MDEKIQVFERIFFFYLPIFQIGKTFVKNFTSRFFSETKKFRYSLCDCNSCSFLYENCCFIRFRKSYTNQTSASNYETHPW